MEGKLRVKPDVIRVELGYDFGRFYQWFINRELRRGFYDSGSVTNLPAHRPHITLTNDKLRRFHGYIDTMKFRDWDGTLVKFEYDPHIMVGGNTKDFWNFYVKARSVEVEQLKVIFGIKESLAYKGMHVTLANTKGLKNQKPEIPWKR